MKKFKGIPIIVPFIRIFGMRGMAIFPFIITQREELKENESYLNHENIHIQQQIELLVIPFFILYLLEWLIRKITRPTQNAYRNLSFEIEAYSNEDDLNYISKRKWYTPFKHMFK
jgi:hypothetical protein